MLTRSISLIVIQMNKRSIKIKLALWDIRAQVMQQPLYRLLGGAPRKIKAYAGGIALGWQEPSSLANEALEHIANGFRVRSDIDGALLSSVPLK